MDNLEEIQIEYEKVRKEISKLKLEKDLKYQQFALLRIEAKRILKHSPKRSKGLKAIDPELYDLLVELKEDIKNINMQILNNQNYLVEITEIKEKLELKQQIDDLNKLHKFLNNYDVTNLIMNYDLNYQTLDQLERDKTLLHSLVINLFNKCWLSQLEFKELNNIINRVYSYLRNNLLCQKNVRN